MLPSLSSSHYALLLDTHPLFSQKLGQEEAFFYFIRQDICTVFLRSDAALEWTPHKHSRR
jgi:hypothetical protein